MKQPLHLILLVDDDDTTNFLNERLLARLKITEQIKVVKNGDEALKFLHESADNGDHLPELVFLDIKMPVMDGFEFLEEYQKLPDQFKKGIVIMMLTSSASAHDLERIKQYSSVQRHISKPLLEAHVHKIMQEYFGTDVED